jgi:lipopolysaccharide export system protein LptA
MRSIFRVLCPGVLCLGLAASLATLARAASDEASAPALAAASALHSTSSPATAPAPSRMEVTADQSLEWYQDKRLYVARGNAKAVRGDLIVESDILTAHERDLPPPAPPQADGKPAPKVKQPKKADPNGTGDIDLMTADGNVRITTQKGHVFGDHAVYDLDKHVAFVKGNNLRYITPEETVTARDSLEYWEERKVAVARGNAVAVRGDRHVEGDVLTAQFRDEPNGKSQMQTLTADGHVTVITKGDVSRGDRAVYDVARDIAIITGHVKITRADGTELNGDVGEMDFATNRSRLLNEGKNTRVRVLLTSKATSKAGQGSTGGSSAQKGAATP